MPLALHLRAILVPSSERRGSLDCPHAVQEPAELHAVALNLVDPIGPVVEGRRQLQSLPPDHDFAQSGAMPQVSADRVSPPGERAGRDAVSQSRQAPRRPRQEHPLPPRLAGKLDPSRPRGENRRLAKAADAPRNFQPVALHLLRPLDPIVEGHGEAHPLPTRANLTERAPRALRGASRLHPAVERAREFASRRPKDKLFDDDVASPLRD